jgi:DNA-binding HxlR family transcriptional regulator
VLAMSPADRDPRAAPTASGNPTPRLFRTPSHTFTLSAWNWTTPRQTADRGFNCTHSYYTQRAPFARSSDRENVTCILQVMLVASNVSGKSKPRSGCPVSISLDRLGDHWSLLIVRDLMVRGFRTFKQFQEAGEGIATNILADRLQKLQAAGIIVAEVEAKDGRRVNYRLTEKGIDLAPVILELLVWGARHEETGAPYAVVIKMTKDRDKLLSEVRRRWRERDSTPLIPYFVMPKTERRRVKRTLSANTIRKGAKKQR